MRSSVLHLISAVALLASADTLAVAQTRPAPKSAEALPPPPPPKEGQVKTSEQIKSDSVQGAATAPLRDLNVMRADIPDVLLAALTDPYARPPRNWKCAQLVALIQPLDAALGADIDTVPVGDENLMDRSKGTALSVAGDVASSLIPFRGVVRRVSGAASHDALVQSSVIAGNVRRAYLKGLGEARGCPPPATPSHERAGSAPASDRRMPTPKYPTRVNEPDAQTSAGTPPAPQPKSRS